jgi:hypothetical protein
MKKMIESLNQNALIRLISKIKTTQLMAILGVVGLACLILPAQFGKGDGSINTGLLLFWFFVGATGIPAIIRKEFPSPIFNDGLGAVIQGILLVAGGWGFGLMFLYFMLFK